LGLRKRTIRTLNLRHSPFFVSQNQRANAPHRFPEDSNSLQT
jgi:hypothetical protein